MRWFLCFPPLWCLSETTRSLREPKELCSEKTNLTNLFVLITLSALVSLTVTKPSSSGKQAGFLPAWRTEGLLVTPAGVAGVGKSSCTSTVHVPVPAVSSCPCLGLKLAAWGRCLEGARRCSLCPHRAGASGCLDNHLFSLPRHLPCSIKVRSPAGHSGFVVLTLALFAPRLVGSPFREDGTGQLKPPYRPVGM